VKSLKSKQSIIPTLTSGDIIATSNLEKANLLNASLVKNFNHSSPVLTLSDLQHTSPDSCPTNFLCTEEEVYSLLSTLDTTKANGHDDISARMLKETALSITPAVTELFNISIRLGELPDEWKVSRVSPIPKNQCSNYCSYFPCFKPHSPHHPSWSIRLAHSLLYQTSPDKASRRGGRDSKHFNNERPPCKH